MFGEFVRAVDDRRRVSLPADWVKGLDGAEGACVLVKERPGCIALWNATTWRARFDPGVELLEAKYRGGRLDDRLGQLQSLGRLLSTRHTDVVLGGRGRVVLPESFLQFVDVQPGGELTLVGAGVCIEFWNGPLWRAYLDEQISQFQSLFDQLTS